MYKELINKIRSAETIIIFGHKNPDGDSLGAALGLQHLIVENFGKMADVAYDGNLPDKYDFMPGFEGMKYAEKIFGKKYDLVISVDAADTRLVGEAQMSLFSAAGDTIKIDHHKTGDDFAKLNIVKTDFVAASEIIYEIACNENWTIGADAANCLYLGIYTDTGGFSYLDNGNAMRVAAELVDMGADARMIPPKLDRLTRDDIMAEAEILLNTEFFHDGQLAIMSVPHRLYKKLDSGETPLLMRMRSVKGVRVIIVLKEAKSKTIRVSLRSENIPVRGVAEKLGGGGHDFAAGLIMDTDIDSAKKILVEEFSDLL